MMDKRDSLKSKIHIVCDNKKKETYFYEVSVHTGGRINAGTNSNVFINLFGSSGDSDVRELKSASQRHKNFIFKRNSADSFIVSVSRNLGNLYACRIFHDNSGQTGKASWYLKHVIIQDLQTKERFVFICEKWFALDKGDGSIDRLMPVCGDAQQKELGYLLSRETKNKLSDGHLWFSILARPTLSSFTRMDRLTCCFVLLYITMLGNILYYDVDNSPQIGGIKIGPLVLTQQQVKFKSKFEFTVVAMVL